MPRTDSDLKHVDTHEAKWVYGFHLADCEGDGSMRDLLGGKGANLAQMSRLGLPVPPGFTVTTQACMSYHKQNGRFPSGLLEQVWRAVRKLEQQTQKQFGGSQQPLLLSVRSGAARSMPGMMDTVLNLGMNDRVCAALSVGSDHRRFALDAYRRLINMFGDVVMGIEHDAFEEHFDRIKTAHGALTDAELGEEGLIELLDAYKRIFASRTGKPFPQNPRVQLRHAIGAVLNSWNTPRAIAYREIHGITDLVGTAANVQTMVFGNLDPDSASGVGFTRNPATGENKLFGEYLRQAQGEDVVAGIRTPEPIGNLKKWKSRLYQELVRATRVLESHFRDMQDMEFTIEQGRLFVLQTRSGKRTAAAAVRIACDMVRHRLIDRREAVNRVDATQIMQLLLPSFDPSPGKEVLTCGLAASPGAATGKPAFTVDEALTRSNAGESIILVRSQTSADDVQGMHQASGVLTSTGGITSHAAVVARGWGKPCVVGAEQIHVEPARRRFTVNGRSVTWQDTISLDGASGEVMLGSVPMSAPGLSHHASTILNWADDCRTLGVRANADTPDDARRAREFGAEGIGLCRTEHMFFGEERIRAMQRMILAEDEKPRVAALDELLPFQREDFIGILSAMRGCPVTIRLLDPPLHEFLPTEADDQRELALELGISVAKLRRSIAQHHEANPMLGNRGCRLLITAPGVLEMQVRAIVEATIACRRKRIAARPQIMVPLVCHENELRLLRDQIERVVEQVPRALRFSGQLEIPIGTMIETPRAALTADRIARCADFFSFGTNDLTQMTLGISRDDVGSFMPLYLEKHVVDTDPFSSIDVQGVGQLIKTAVDLGRRRKPDIGIGICGEHGGEPNSIRFCQEAGVDYVSCSPFRVPVARLAAGHAAIAKDKERTSAK